MADFMINNGYRAGLSAPASARQNPAKSQDLQSAQSLQNTQKLKPSVSESTDKVLEERQKLAAQKSLTEKLKDEPDELDKTISQLNDSLQNYQRNLEFSVDNDSGKIVINVTDKETDKVVRQIPSEEVLELARNLQELNHSDLKSNNGLGEQSGHIAEGVFFKSSV